ncbi:MAG: hypothetical protein Q8R12_02440 [bacterium]|nr:hypothetical protein [bacterium]
MKGCFLLQRKFAWLGHALAVELKEKYGVSEFCGYVQSRKAERFLRRRGDLKYTSLLVDEDIWPLHKTEKLDFAYLKKLEAEYGEPNLWKFITVDRTIMLQIPPLEYTFRPSPLLSHEEMLCLLQIRFRATIKFLEKEKPDFLICSAVAGMSSRILYHIAKKMGIKTITIEPSRIKKFVTLSKNYLRLTGAEEIFKKLQRGERTSPKKEEAKLFLEEFRKKPAVSTYAPALARFDDWNKFKFLLPQNFLKSLGWILRLSLEHLQGLHKNDYAEEAPWGILKSRIARKLRGLYGYRDLYDRPDWSEDFAYYQLHYEPEMAMLLYAPSWPDQLEVIRHIAKSLPVHFKLYVREHRAMVNYRPRAFYKELKKIPNVKLIAPEVDLFELVEHAKLVTVITSTVGWEAALLGKPVITFGDVFFNKLSTVKKCTEIEKLPELVKAQLENFRPNDAEILNYLAAIFEDSVEVDYFKLWEREFDFKKIKTDPGIKNLAGLVAKKLGLGA